MNSIFMSISKRIDMMKMDRIEMIVEEFKFRRIVIIDS
jgi:hypothetical protein